MLGFVGIGQELPRLPSFNGEQFVLDFKSYKKWWGSDLFWSRCRQVRRSRPRKHRYSRHASYSSFLEGETRKRTRPLRLAPRHPGGNWPHCPPRTTRCTVRRATPSRTMPPRRLTRRLIVKCMTNSHSSRERPDRRRPWSTVLGPNRAEPSSSAFQNRQRQSLLLVVMSKPPAPEPLANDAGPSSSSFQNRRRQ